MSQGQRGRIVVVALFCAAALGVAGSAEGGWVIDQGGKGSGDNFRQQVSVQANRMKTVTLEPSGQPMAAFILDLVADTVTQVMYADRSYMRGTVAEFVQMNRAAQDAARQQMARMSQDMDKVMKNLPPEQRKAMEEAMRGASAAPAGAECREPRVEIRRAGQQATIAGHNAVRYDLLADGKATGELWLAPGITAWQELDRDKLERFFKTLASLGPSCGPAGRTGFPGGDAASFPRDGYAVRMVHGEGVTMEVTRAERRTVSAAEFEPPAGFTRRPYPKLP